MPFCTQLADREFSEVPITMTTNIVDITGVGLKQFWDLKSHMQAASQLATAHYPETLDRIFIVGAPSFFSTVWGWIKRWFDPITVSKIFILSPQEVRPTLESFIDPKNIPEKYGGQLEYAWGDNPVNDPAWQGVVDWQNGHQGFPTGPLFWEDIDGGERMQCVSLTNHGDQRNREVVCTMPKTWPPRAAGATTTTTTTTSAAAAATTTMGTEAGVRTEGAPVSNGQSESYSSSEQTTQENGPQRYDSVMDVDESLEKKHVVDETSVGTAPTVRTMVA